MTQDMSDDMVKQAIIDLQELVRCICSPALKDRNLHSPDCRGYDASNVALLSDRIEELEAKLAKALEVKKAQQLMNYYAVEVVVYGATVSRLRNLEDAWTNLRRQATLAELKAETHE